MGKRMKGQKIGRMLTMLGLLLFYMVDPVHASGIALSVDVSEYVRPGDEFEAQVILKDPVAVQAMSFSLQFDSSKLEIIKVNGQYFQPGAALTNALIIYPDGGLVNGNTVTLAAGWTINGGLTYTGEKSLGKIRFKAVEEGKAVLKFIKTEMTNNNNFHIVPLIQGDTVQVDGTGPSIEISNLYDGVVINNKFPTLSAKVNDSGSGVDGVKVNGQDAVPDGNGNWTSAVHLITEGENEIKVEAVDKMGNISQQSIMVILDTQGPVLKINEPVNGEKTNQKTVTVSGTVENGATLTVNGENVFVGGDGSWLFPLTLAEGKNDITVIAEDQVGNVTIQVINVILDKTVILFSVDGPLNNGKTKRAVITVSGKVEAGAVVRVNGTNAKFKYGLKTRWYARVKLTEGKNEITVVAEDLAGNSATRVLEVIRVPKWIPYRERIPGA